MRATFKAIVSIACILTMSLSVFSQQVAKTIPNSTAPEGLIGFLEFKPKDYGTQKHPLIIFLHGIGERGNGTSQVNIVANNAIPNLCARGASMRFTVNGQTSSFVVLSPQLSTSYGYWPSFYVREMLKYAKANLQIDPDRVYITGLSLGGGGTWRAITDTDNGDYSFDAGIAAAAPVCGTQDEIDGNFCATIGANHLPVWGFHCVDDGTVYYGATQHAEQLSKNCGVTPASIFTYYQSGGHGGAWTNAYDTGHITRTLSNGTSFTANPNLYEWFLSNKRSTGTSTPAYTAPVANAGAAQIITLPVSAVTLTGSGAGTNGATVSSYSWTQTSGPSVAAISVPLLNTTLVAGLVQGTYVFTLKVTDNHGLSTTSAVTVTVNAALAANQNPISNAGSDVSITLPTNSVTLDGSASSDPDGKIVEYYWTKVGGPAGGTFSDAFTMRPTFSGLAEGTYIAQLQVKDDRGGVGYSSKKIVVSAAPITPSTPNQPPVSVAGADVTITLPTNSVTLDGSASSDPDGKIAEYYWTKVGGPAGGTFSDAFSMKPTFSGLVAGTYIAQLQVKDDKGVTGYSSKKIIVNPASATPSNQQPVSIAGSDVTITLPTNSVALDGGASYDNDGKIIQYYWSKIAGPASGKFSDQLAMNPTFSGLEAGVYVVMLQVKDDNGGIAYSGKKITVLDGSGGGTVNQAPVPVTGNATITLPTNAVVINGSSSYDPDGKIVQYYWKQLSGPSIAYIKDLFSADMQLGNLVQGKYAFELQVKDNNGGVAWATAVVTVNAAGTRLAADGTVAASAAELAAKDPLVAGKVLSIYPNPVQSAATLELYSADNSMKNIFIYTSNGILAAKYTWQTVAGKNVFSIKNISGLTNGIYIVDVKDSNGKSNGTLKFVKVN